MFKDNATTEGGNTFYNIPETAPEYRMILRAMYAIIPTDGASPLKTSIVFERLGKGSWSHNVSYAEYRSKDGEDTSMDFNAYEIHYFWETTNGERMHLKWVAVVNELGETGEWFPCVHVLDASGKIIKNYEETACWDIAARICNNDYFIK